MSFVRGRGRGRGFIKNSDSHHRKCHTQSVSQNQVSSGSSVLSISQTTQICTGLVTVQNSTNINLIRVDLNLDCDSEEWFLRLRNLWNLCK